MRERGVMTLKIAGQKFGRLLVIEQHKTKKNEWVCACDCGNTTSVLTYNLKSGNTRSCGCLQKERASQASIASIAGKQFGRLTAISIHHKTNKGSFWLCKCSCGGEKIARADTLSNGNTKSCGCIRAEAIAAASRKDITGLVFGKLTASKVVGSTKSGNVIWMCTCSCGGEKKATTAKLMGGLVVSCGCARTDPKVYSSPKILEKSAEYAAKRRGLKMKAGGSFTADEIRELYKKQRGLCAFCRCSLKNGYHRDHIVALANGGDNTIYNIQLLCPGCNHKKHSKDPIEWAQQNGFLL